MSDKPLFSVLIANYNNGKYLAEAINSVENQTYSNWEVVIVDDASSDSSPELYKELSQHKQIRIFFNKQNRGCGFTKNRCVAEAKGEILAFLDPDDALAPNAIQLLIAEHSKSINYSLIYSTHFLCNEDLSTKKINPNIGQVLPLIFKSNKSISHFASFKKSYYNLIDPINPVLPRAVDMDLYYKLSEVGEIQFVNKPLYYYRQHNQGISSFNNALKAKYWHAVVVKNTYQRRLKKGIPTISKKEQEKYFYDYYLWKSIEKHKSKNFLKVYYYLFQAFKLNFSDSIKLKMKLLFPFSRF